MAISMSSASFFEIIRLEKNARVVMTDSGGVQKEAFFFETPCVILRPETEWVEIVEAGAGVIADADYQRIMDGYRHPRRVSRPGRQAGELPTALRRWACQREDPRSDPWSPVDFNSH